MGKLINRILGSRLLISSLPGSALKTHVESLGKPRDVNKRSHLALPGKLDIKRHSPSILYISASLAMSTSVLKALPGKLDIKRHSTGPRSAVGSVSGYRCVSDCRSRDREFDPGPVPYFRGD